MYIALFTGPDMDEGQIPEWNPSLIEGVRVILRYLGSMQYYFKPVREMPTGYGFADLIFVPKPEYVNSYPAMVMELKWNKDAETAMKQIKEKKYPESLLQYTGDILLVGINYDPDIKAHECLIEKYEK